MSLADFQRAFGRALLEPVAWEAYLVESNVPMGLRLTRRERTRLLHILRHRGMAANQLLLNSNRMQPIYGALPLTCDWLRPDMTRLIDAWTRASVSASVQYARETTRFAEWLPGFLTGRLPHPALDALRYELGLQRLVESHPSAGPDAAVMVRFEHDPDRVLEGYRADLEPLPTPVDRKLAIVRILVVLAPA